MSDADFRGCRRNDSLQPRLLAIFGSLQLLNLRDAISSPDAAGFWQELTNIHSFIHYTLSNPQIRCVAADILWQYTRIENLWAHWTRVQGCLQPP